MRILALDVGDRRIGVAISDKTGTIARAVATLDRNKKNIVKELRTISKKYEISKIIIGLPLRSNGTEGIQVKKVRIFAKHLQEELGLPLQEWDERLTSVQAERLLITADLKRAKRKVIIDQVAATLILQSYLDNVNRKK